MGARRICRAPIVVSDEGNSVKKDETHRRVDANKAFALYRWQVVLVQL